MDFVLGSLQLCMDLYNGNGRELIIPVRGAKLLVYLSKHYVEKSTQRNLILGVCWDVEEIQQTDSQSPFSHSYELSE